VSSERWRRVATTAAAVLAGLAVLAGAFGAHALRDRFGPSETALWETAARYQMYHALALLLLASLFPQRPPPLIRVAGTLFVIGIVLFSGSLYVLAMTGRRWLGAITPFGGLALLAGWACVALGSLRRPAPTV
jgi:uncharacterized membrane protein YgdD (TMEM256/DUF423 family)